MYVDWDQGLWCRGAVNVANLGLDRETSQLLECWCDEYTEQDMGMNPDFDWNDWVSRGAELAVRIQNQLPSDIVIRYDYIEGVSPSFKRDELLRLLARLYNVRALPGEEFVIEAGNIFVKIDLSSTSRSPQLEFFIGDEIKVSLPIQKCQTDDDIAIAYDTFFRFVAALVNGFIGIGTYRGKEAIIHPGQSGYDLTVNNMCVQQIESADVIPFSREHGFSQLNI